MPEPTRTQEVRSPAARRPLPARARRLETARVVGAASLGAIAMLFAVLNVDEVEVNWLLGTWSTPLIIVIVVSFLLGAAVDRLLVARRARRR